MKGIDTIKTRREQLQQLIKPFQVVIKHQANVSQQQKENALVELQNYSIQQDTFLINLYKNILQNNYKQFGILDDEVAYLLKKIQKEFSEISLQQKQHFKNIKDIETLHLQMLLLQSNTLQKFKYIENRFITFVSIDKKRHSCKMVKF